MSASSAADIRGFRRHSNLREAGHKVVVLEAETVGYGASGRNGGQICTGFSSGQDKIAAQLGKEDARRCFMLAEESKRLLTDRIKRYGIDCDLRWGYLHVLPKPNRMDGLKQWKEEWDALGYTDTRLIGRRGTVAEARQQGLSRCAARGRCGAFPPAELLPGAGARRYGGGRGDP